MSPIDGPILLISEIYLAHTSGVNISKAQPSKAKGLGGVECPVLAFYYIDKITQMSPIDGPILLISEIYLAHTSGINISKAQPSKAKGLGEIAGPILRILIYII